MKIALIKYTICLSIFFQFGQVNAFSSADTIPPVFTTIPMDLTVSCESDILSEFTLWYNNSANAVADNGEAELEAVHTLEDAIDSLDSYLTQCLNTGSYSLGFFAVDSCNNISLDTLFADFIVQDTERPLITDPGRSLAMLCNEFSYDSLVNWVQNAAYATAVDNCDGSPDWVNYSWTDIHGNSGFGNIGEDVAINISRQSCLWSVELRFFIRDECGNINSNTAIFSIEGDEQIPEIISAPPDTTILCHQIADTIAPLIIDGCDGELNMEFMETSSQSSDTSSCAHYEYQIERIWSTEDACGNAVSYTQHIEVVDTLAPTLNFESIISKECDDDLDLIGEFIEYTDNCSVRSVEYIDTLLFSSLCVSQYDREYRLTDQCDNERIVNQRIQVEDFSGPDFIQPPQDQIVYCGSSNINLNFQSWINAFANAVINDNCNGHTQYARNSPNLTDSISVVQAPDASLDPIRCIEGLAGGLIFSQDFFFYAIDDCGNISSRTASFNLLDTIAPVIPNCPNDLDIILESDECDSYASINLPFSIDPCLSFDDTKWTIKIDEDFLFEETMESIDFNFDIGQHEIEYTLSDCSGNSSSCVQNISVIDTFPPMIVCPQDIEYYLPSDSCMVSLSVPEINSFSDNCFGIADFSATQPEGGGFIKFEYNPLDSSYSASSFAIEFDDIINDQRFFKPVITIEYALNIDVRSRLVLKSELSEELFVAEKAPCVRQKQKLVLNEAQFEIWSIDHDIKFNVSVEKNGGKGILPCVPENLDGPEDIDEFSFFMISLEFTEVDPDFTISDSSSQILYENEKDIFLPSGEFELNYFAEDFAGNSGSCSTKISVRDTFPPEINCIDQEVVLTPETEEFIDIVLDDLNILVDDNCEIETISYFPSDFSCQQINRTIPLVVQAWDVNGNFSFCTANLQIRASALEPQFIGGLCLADTLKLFANLDPAITGNFLWTGPNGFTSTERDPVITNIDESNSGVYRVELTTDKACDFSGVINIDISSFLSPELISQSSLICENETISLESNTFSEEVQYYWFEGISPNGILLNITDDPILELSPGLGTHSYYLEVEGEGCRSLSSQKLDIEVLKQPKANISESFITVCDGEEIILSSVDSIPGYEYLWTGPGGYTSARAFPDPIQNASLGDEGLYSLVVRNQICDSEEDMAQVLVLQAPPKPIVEIEDSYCESETAELIVSNIPSTGNVFHWYLNGSLFSSQSSNTFVIADFTAELSGVWTVIVDDGECSSEVSDDVQLSIEAIPNIGASNNGPVCEGDTIQLTASFIPNATYVWEGPSGSRFFTREASPLAIEGNYTVTVTTSNGCQNTASTFVEVGLRPQITALSNSATDCMLPNSSFTLNPTVFPPGNYNYVWSGPNSFNSDETNPIVDNIDQSVAGLYQLFVIEEECSSEVVGTLVDFTLIPEAASITGDSAVCENASLYLEIMDPIDDGSAIWIWQTPQGQLSTNDPFLLIDNFNNTLQGNYSVFQELGSCRSEISNSINVRSIDEIEQARINGSNLICEGDNIELIASGPPNSIYNWILPEGDTVSLSAHAFTITDAKQTDEGIYKLFIQQGICTSPVSEGFEISVLPKPEAPEFEEAILYHCKSEDNPVELCLDIEPNEFDFIQLSDSSNGNVLSMSSENCLSVDINDYLDQDSIVLLARTNKDNCWSDGSNELIVILEDIPQLRAEYLQQQIILCENYELSISADTIPDGIMANWTSPDPEIIILGEDSLSTRISNLRSGINEIFLNSSNESCGTFAYDTVELIVIDEITARNDQFNLQYGDEINLDVLSNDSYDFPVLFESKGNNLLGDLSFTNDILSFENNQLYGEFNIEYTICYEECPDICSTALISLNIKDDNNCLVGNIISNNNDGINDLFKITCLEDDQFPNNSLVIFNRWGDEIYRASPYENDWRGTYLNEKLPSGTYFYWLDLGDDSEILNGFIVVE